MLEPGSEPAAAGELCPHRSVLDLPAVPVSEEAKDQLRLICLQAQLGYVLIGLLGERRLKSYGYPHQSVKARSFKNIKRNFQETVELFHIFVTVSRIN